MLDGEIGEAEIDPLRDLHESFEATHPEWRDRVEVLYISRKALLTFEAEPRGRVARISPGEPLHYRELDGVVGWLLDWHGVISRGETLHGPAPLTIGPGVGPAMFRAAVISQLREMLDIVRGHDVAYVPAQQGYIVATVCRGLYSLATGEVTSKEAAITWYAERHPDEADLVWATYRAYRADVRGPHQRLIASSTPPWKAPSPVRPEKDLRGR